MSESLNFIFKRANSALITQDFEYAERLLTNALKKHRDISPSDREKIERLLARIYGDEGKLDRSLAAYLRLYERSPDNIELMLNLGRIYRHLGRYEEALEILNKAHAMGGDTDEVLYNLAKTYKRMGEYPKSAECFSRAIEIKPDHAHAYDRLGNLYVLTGEIDKAIEIYKQGLRVDSNHPYLNFHLAGLLRQEKRYEDAIVYYNSALRVNPVWSEVLAGIAAAYLELNKLDDALNTYRSLLRVTGENAPLYTELGYLFEKKQLQQEAEQYYYDALAIDSGYAPAALALTKLLEKKQRYNEVLPILLAAEAAPVNADNHTLRLKAIQMCMYAKDYARAYELFGRLDAEHSNSLNALKLRGQLYALTGEFEQAEETFKKILTIAPSAIEFRKELAEQYFLAHRYEEAKEQLELFLKQKPADISALMALGKTEELLNNPQAAYQEYQKVLELKPDAIEAHSALAQLFQKRGDTIAALKTANEIVNMQSGFESDEPEQDLAASLDLYERVAEKYIADPLLTKNLEQLKSDDAYLYISPTELNPEPEQRIPSLRDISRSEQELPFEMLIEGAEEVKELPPEKDDIAIDGIQLGGAQQQGIGQSAFLPYASAVSEPHAFGAENFDSTGFAATENSAGGVSQTRNNVPTGQTAGGAASEAFAAPVEDLYLDPDYFENNAVFEVGPISQKNTQRQHKRQNLLRDEAIQERLKVWDTYGTTMGFLQDVISDIDKKLDSNQFAQAIEVLAERIAENLSQKIPIPPVTQQEESQPQQQQLQPEEVPQPEATIDVADIADERDVPVDDDMPIDKLVSMNENIPAADDAAIDVPVDETIPVDGDITIDKTISATANVLDDEDNVEIVETQEDALFGAAEDLSLMLEADDPPIMKEIGQDDTAADTEEVAAETIAAQHNSESEDDVQAPVDDELFLEDSGIEKEQAQGANPDSFMLDQDQQNLLWCHAKHQIKASPSFEQYLNTADPEQLAQLFLYLRDLFTYLPQGELETFLNSSERMQIYYIIARLSGGLDLKERADLVRQAYSVVAAPPPYNDEAILKLLIYLRDLSMAMPDQELGMRVRQELEQLMANMSAVMPVFA